MHLLWKYEDTKDNKNFELKYHIVVKKKIPKGNQGLQVEGGQTIQWSKERKNDKQRSPSHAQKTTNPTK